MSVFNVVVGQEACSRHVSGTNMVPHKLGGRTLTAMLNRGAEAQPWATSTGPAPSPAPSRVPSDDMSSITTRPSTLRAID